MRVEISTPKKKFELKPVIDVKICFHCFFLLAKGIIHLQLEVWSFPPKIPSAYNERYKTLRYKSIELSVSAQYVKILIFFVH